MARKNKLGTSFLGLGLEEKEEQKFKKRMEFEDKSAKQIIRKLVREYLKTI